MTKVVQLQPQSAEAWYDLGSLRTKLGRPADAIPALSNALTISNARRATNPAATDLQAAAKGDAQLNPLRSLPEFQKLVPQ
jgi:cytochrome c-type biogenesis protein CcmH/NrfG